MIRSLALISFINPNRCQICAQTQFPLPLSAVNPVFVCEHWGQSIAPSMTECLPLPSSHAINAGSRGLLWRLHHRWITCTLLGYWQRCLDHREPALKESNKSFCSVEWIKDALRRISISIHIYQKENSRWHEDEQQFHIEFFKCQNKGKCI